MERMLDGQTLEVRELASSEDADARRYERLFSEQLARRGLRFDDCAFAETRAALLRGVARAKRGEVTERELSDSLAMVASRIEKKSEAGRVRVDALSGLFRTEACDVWPFCEIINYYRRKNGADGGTVPADAGGNPDVSSD